MNAIVTLPLVLAIVLIEIAVGGAFLVWFLDRRGQAPGGFLKLACVVDAVCAAAAVGLIPTIIPNDLQKVGLDPAPLGSFGQALVVFLVMVIIQAALTFLPSSLKDLRSVAGVLTILVGVGTLEIAAISRPPSSAGPYDIFALLVLPLGSLGARRRVCRDAPRPLVSRHTEAQPGTPSDSRACRRLRGRAAVDRRRR